VRTNTAVLFTWVLFAVVFATACTGNAGSSSDSEEGQAQLETKGESGNTEASKDSEEDQAQLKIKGKPGTEFSGSCVVGNEEQEEIGGQVPERIIFVLKGKPLDCEISSEGDARVDLTVGKNVHSVHRVSGGILNLTYENGSTSASASSVSTQSGFSSSETDEEDSSTTDGSSNVTSESRNVSGFEEVEFEGVGYLFIRQTGSESLTVEAEEDILSKIRTEVDNDRLIIGPKPNTDLHTTKPINYTLNVKDLHALKLSGSGDMDAQGISTDKLAITISGAGAIKTSGRADSQDIDIGGVGNYQAEDLESKEVKITVEGAGSAVVNVSDKLDAKVSGSGSVEYIGDPTVDQDVSGVGRVSKR
jgi:hypothetical protein